MGIWYDKKAYELLKKCSDAKDLTEWNEYRKVTSYTPINLRFSDLRNFYLQKAELQNVDFRGATVSHADFQFADVKNANISLFIFQSTYILSFVVGVIFAWMLIAFGIVSANILIKMGIFGAIAGSFIIISVIIGGKISSSAHLINIFIHMIAVLTIAVIGIAIQIIGNMGILEVVKIISYEFNNFPLLSGIIGILNVLNITFALVGLLLTLFSVEGNSKVFLTAINPEKAIGFNSKDLKNTIKSVVQELQKEATELNKSIELTHDDEEKEKLVYRLEKLEEKIQFYDVQEEKASLQKTQIENIIGELQAPYEYIHQTITKIEWHNRFYYGAIVVLIGTFIYAILHGYVDQKMATFASLFTKETLPSFGTIFGVILFFGSPILIGISLIIYFIAQINKNIDKITELQEQERNIKQIASTIKAKAQVGMSDEEFVKETKNLIQKYQEGMMAGMFTKDKTLDKEDKSSSSTYREKMIANGMSKLLMQALKK